LKEICTNFVDFSSGFWCFPVPLRFLEKKAVIYFKVVSLILRLTDYNITLKFILLRILNEGFEDLTSGYDLAVTHKTFYYKL